MNTPIQGSAADIIKLAMVRIQRRLETKGLQTRMVLQVHDELIFDTLQEELATVAALVKEDMENVLALRVPLVVDLKYGASKVGA
jgi:DNA polymerase-1